MANKTTQKFTAETELGPTEVTAEYWSDSPNPSPRYQPAKFSLHYRVGDPYTQGLDRPKWSINGIEYSADSSVEFHEDEQGNWHRAIVRNYPRRHDDKKPTDKAYSAIYQAILRDALSRNIAALVQTARATHAQYMADNEIEQAKAHLETARKWSGMMATGDARHYERGFHISSNYSEAEEQ